MTIQDGPVALVMSRQNLPVLDRGLFGPAAALTRAPTSLPTPRKAPQVILIASGSEVHTALAAREELAAEGFRCGW